MATDSHYTITILCRDWENVVVGAENLAQARATVEVIVAAMRNNNKATTLQITSDGRPEISQTIIMRSSLIFGVNVSPALPEQS